jgi:hypothetical protein
VPRRLSIAHLHTRRGTARSPAAGTGRLARRSADPEGRCRGRSARVVRRHDRAAFSGHLDALTDRAPFVRGDQADRPFLDLRVIREGPVTGRKDSDVGVSRMHVPQPKEPF